MNTYESHIILNMHIFVFNVKKKKNDKQMDT